MPAWFYCWHLAENGWLSGTGMMSSMKWVGEIEFTLNIYENHNKFLFAGVTFHVQLSGRKGLFSFIIPSGDLMTLGQHSVHWKLLLKLGDTFSVCRGDYVALVFRHCTIVPNDQTFSCCVWSDFVLEISLCSVWCISPKSPTSPLLSSLLLLQHTGWGSWKMPHQILTAPMKALFSSTAHPSAHNAHTYTQAHMLGERESESHAGSRQISLWRVSSCPSGCCLTFSLDDGGNYKLRLWLALILVSDSGMEMTGQVNFGSLS